ncbi:hypothetical protein GCM10023329_12330 [Streptomyces sanyensis]|uniref:Transposase n=1 Tax=Streptomyces sanyensis TaxID=568869 RepID=A0ABP8ZW77_9ACTN
MNKSSGTRTIDRVQVKPCHDRESAYCSTSKNNNAKSSEADSLTLARKAFTRRRVTARNLRTEYPRLREHTTGGRTTRTPTPPEAGPPPSGEPGTRTPVHPPGHRIRPPHPAAARRSTGNRRADRKVQFRHIS